MAKFKAYSQYGEDYFIWKYFQRKTSGLIIEVGAFDGKYFSTSYSLEKKGWTSICIEANPESYRSLLKNRQEATCLQFALVEDETQQNTTFYTEAFGLYSGIMPNTDLEQIYHNKRKKIDLHKIVVPCTTLNKILRSYPSAPPKPIDCITIDVEGTEIDILKGINIDFYQPKLFIIEANTKVEQDIITKYLSLKQYSLVQKLGPNLIFTRMENQSSPISIDLNNINPAFQIHPKGLDYTEQSPLFIQKKPILNRFFQRFLRFRNILKSSYKNPI